nr:hypothetical protein BaRGS_032669 [Batillaria attramentaria]
MQLQYATLLSDEDFFRRVAQEVVTSHLFDVDDEKELPNSLDYFVLRPNIVNNYVPKFLIGHDYPMCGEVGGGGGGSGEKGGAEDTYPFILMFVFSQISHIHTREVIRQTWGQPSSNWVRNPTVSALYWARNYCPGVPHVMKVDSDTFVNVPELANLLTILPNRAASADGHRWMLGAFHRNPVVHRSGKWEVDPAVYPMERFPSALFGHSYVISGCVIEDLLRAYHRLPFVPIEDAFFTGHRIGKLVRPVWDAPLDASYDLEEERDVLPR